MARGSVDDAITSKNLLYISPCVRLRWFELDDLRVVSRDGLRKDEVVLSILSKMI